MTQHHTPAANFPPGGGSQVRRILTRWPAPGPDKKRKHLSHCQTAWALAAWLAAVPLGAMAQEGANFPVQNATPGPTTRQIAPGVVVVETPKTPDSLPDPVRFGNVVELGDLRQVARWLDAGLPPDYLADKVGTGLMIAAWEGNIPMMELFLQHGADVNARNRLGEQALLHAAWKGRKEAVQWLLDHGAAVNRQGQQWSALHYAAFAGQGDIARLLLERGADINGRSPNGSSVLMMAIYEGHDDLAKELIEKGADRSIRNENGEGALEWAMKFDRTAVARLVASSEDFASAAARPKESWGEPRQSYKPTPTLDDLLKLRRSLESRGLYLDAVDRRIAAERAKIARDASVSDRPPRADGKASMLEITADRKQPSKQQVRLVPVEGGRAAPARSGSKASSGKGTSKPRAPQDAR